MKVCKCDRCGNIFQPQLKDNDFYSRVIQVAEETFSLTETVGEVTESYDLCDNCYRSFCDWLQIWQPEDKEK